MTLLVSQFEISALKFFAQANIKDISPTLSVFISLSKIIFLDWKFIKKPEALYGKRTSLAKLIVTSWVAKS